MAFFERDYIEIKRELSNMQFVGIRHEAIEQPDVEKYLRRELTKAKWGCALGIIGPIFMWALALAPVMLDYLYGYQHRVSSFSIGASVAFSLMAIVVTVLVAKSWKTTWALPKALQPDSPEQQQANAGNALDWLLKKKYELCEAHDMVSVDSALKGFPLTVFIGSFKPSTLNSNDMERRRRECAVLEKIAKAHVDAQVEALKNAVDHLAGAVAAASACEADSASQARPVSLNKQAAPGPDGSLLVYLDIDKLDGGVYGLAAGEAVARAVPASALAGVHVFSGDSAATLRGSAYEYVVALSGSGAALDAAEPLLRGDAALAGLLSAAGIRREAAMREPLVLDGTVQGGALVSPPGQSASFCAAGFNRAWK